MQKKKRILQKKFLLAFSTLALLVVVAASSVGLTMAALRGTVQSTLSIAYQAHNVAAVITGSYSNSTGSQAATLTSGTEDEIVFTGLEDDNLTKYFNPVEDLSFDGPYDYFDIEYIVRNSGEFGFVLSMDLDLAQENVTITYSAKYWNGQGEKPEATFQNAKNADMYLTPNGTDTSYAVITIRIAVSNVIKDAVMDGSFTFFLDSMTSNKDLVWEPGLVSAREITPSQENFSATGEIQAGIAQARILNDGNAEIVCSPKRGYRLLSISKNSNPVHYSEESEKTSIILPYEEGDKFEAIFYKTSNQITKIVDNVEYILFDGTSIAMANRQNSSTNSSARNSTLVVAPTIEHNGKSYNVQMISSAFSTTFKIVSLPQSIKYIGSQAFANPVWIDASTEIQNLLSGRLVDVEISENAPDFAITLGSNATLTYQSGKGLENMKALVKSDSIYHLNISASLAEPKQIEVKVNDLILYLQEATNISQTFRDAVNFNDTIYISFS